MWVLVLGVVVEDVSLLRMLIVVRLMVMFWVFLLYELL